MQPQKPSQSPLTIVGIVNNVMALMLVCLLLYSESRSNWPTLEQLSESIRQIAKTKKVTSEDVIGVLGEPQTHQKNEEFWGVGWAETNRSPSAWNKADHTLHIYYGSNASNGEYIINLAEGYTHQSGLKYIFWNLHRAYRSGMLLPFKPVREGREIDLLLTEPKQ